MLHLAALENIPADSSGKVSRAQLCGNSGLSEIIQDSQGAINFKLIPRLSAGLEARLLCRKTGKRSSSGGVTTTMRTPACWLAIESSLPGTDAGIDGGQNTASILAKVLWVKLIMLLTIVCTFQVRCFDSTCLLSSSQTLALRASHFFKYSDSTWVQIHEQLNCSRPLRGHELSGSFLSHLQLIKIY